jgi:sulfoxide reductase catalytic subunit YedY
MPDDSLEREVTSRELYFNRRTVMRGGAIAASAAATGWLYRRLNGIDPRTAERPAIAPLVKPDPAVNHGFVATDEPTPRTSILNYNNFYEFTTDKDGVAAAAEQFSTAGWQLAVDGLVHRPTVFDMASLRKLAPAEERIYRMRCVEAWSMVVPWVGFSLSRLLTAAQPMGSAKYVALQTLHDPARMPGQHTKVLQWPYVEGLRLDEAMHPLTLLATGLYGQELPPQDGAPVRLVVPWKYGFKGIKSIVKITLTETEPPTSWNQHAPREYGFYANVNPGHAHPRWSQATEQRIGEDGRRPTVMFNGYGEQVAGLYAGMDLDVHY